MKNKALSAIALGCILSLGGCDVLETKDLSNYSPDDVWNDTKLATAYLTDLYAHTLGGWPYNSGNNADECPGIMAKDAIQPNAGGFKPWTYSTIRNINLMLEGLQTGKLTEAQKNPLIGQAYFLRAWHYFNMLRNYGGIPLIDHVQKNDGSEDLKVKRNTSLECFDFIVNDLDKAMALVPEKYSGKDYGRADQCAIAAFKGRVLMLKASPQFNPSKPYSNQYIDEAFAATKAAKELCEKNGAGLVPNYTDVFETEGHKEAILAVVYTNPSKVDGRYEAAVRPLSESKNATGGDQPCFNFVEAFTMKDGKKIDDPTGKYKYDEQTFWLNRDPRFDQTIVYNGAIYELSGKTGRRQYTAKNIALSVDACGFNIQGGESHNRPGLFCKKGIMEELSVAQVGLNDIDWLEIRFAEVLFNYAEMANEKGDQTVGYDVLKQIRERAGIEAGADGMYGLASNMDKEAMRQALLDEKRIEFCFEGQRFNDLRRHRMLHTVLNGMHKYGIMASLKPGVDPDDALERSKAPHYSLLPEEFEYTKFDMNDYNKNQPAAHVYPETYYFFPIPKGQIEQNDNLDQNDGWGGSFKCELP